MRNRALHFDNGRGHRLAARLDLPDARPRGFALLAHCFTCSKNLHATTQVSRALAEAGYGVLRFDFTGPGASEGELANSDFSGNVEDLVAAARFLEAEHQAPQLLVGHSLGGAAVLRAAGRLPAVRAVATIGAPAHPLHVERLLRSAREEIESSGRAEVELAGRRFTITRGFLDDLQEQPMRDAIAGLRRALLVLHAPRDSVVGIDNAAAIFEAAKHPKSFVSLDRADHLLTAHGDADFAGSVIATWAARYLEPLTTDPDAPEPAVGEEVVVRGPEQGFARVTRVRCAGRAWPRTEVVEGARVESVLGGVGPDVLGDAHRAELRAAHRAEVRRLRRLRRQRLVVVGAGGVGVEGELEVLLPVEGGAGAGEVVVPVA